MAILALALAAGACATTYDATMLGVPATLSSAAGARAQGEAFKITTHAVHGLWGAFSIKKPAVAKILAGQLTGGRSLSDIRIRERSRFTDLLVTVLTAGLIVPRSVTVEGVVVK